MNQSIRPSRFKKVIGERAKQFTGYHQQDSQEFLSYLLDGLHEDLNKVTTKPFIEDVDLPNIPDKELAAKYWENFLKRNDSIIVDLFYGQFKSTITCPKCTKVSVRFDPFLVFSLPISRADMLMLEFYLIFRDPSNKILKVKMNLPSNYTVAQLSALLKNKM